MTTIGEFFGIPAPNRGVSQSNRVCSNDLVGVEVEVENDSVGITRPISKWFHVEPDGSLRNRGMEYKFARPYGGQDIVSALNVLEEHCSKNNMECNDRTGLHVHIDVTDLTFKQVLYMVLIYTMYELPLVAYAGKDRETNIYCPSINACEGCIDYLNRLVTDREDYAADVLVGADAAKYSSMNMQNLRRLGTIEFRVHKGTFIAKEILNWINLLLHIKEYAKVFSKDPKDLVHLLSDVGTIPLAYEVFKEHVELILNADFHSEVMYGARLAQDILYKHTLELEEKKIKTSKGTKDLFKEVLIKKAPDYVNHY